MADTAFQIQYRQEFIAGFELRESLVRKTVTTDAQINAQQAVFLVADSGSASAVTRTASRRSPTVGSCSSDAVMLESLPRVRADRPRR